jgi:hypothetical protein
MLFPTMTSEALITAKAGLPSFNSNESTLPLVMIEVPVPPPYRERVTSAFTAPLVRDWIFPASTFRALIFISYLLSCKTWERGFRVPAETCVTLIDCLATARIHGDENVHRRRACMLNIVIRQSAIEMLSGSIH